jgi:hypothetical protein
MDEIAKLDAQVAALRTEIEGHAAALKRAAIGYRIWLALCFAGAAAGALAGHLAR